MVLVYTEALDLASNRLEARGIKPCRDLRDLNPPGVYLVPGRAVFQLRAADVQVIGYLVAAGAGVDPSLGQLDSMLEQARSALPVVDAEPASVQLPAGGDPVPALRISVNTRVRATT